MKKGQDVIEAYDEAAGDRFDLGPILEEFETICEELDDFYGAIEAGEIEPEAANEALRKIPRRIIPIYFVKGGRFEQDIMA